MDCPQCSGLEMNDFFLENESLVRYCSECKSIWLDSTDLSSILVHHNLPGLDAVGGRENLDEAAGTCPEDLTDLVVIESLRNDSLNYAMCEVCGGLWIQSQPDGNGFDCECPERTVKEILNFFRVFSATRHQRI